MPRMLLSLASFMLFFRIESGSQDWTGILPNVSIVNIGCVHILLLTYPSVSGSPWVKWLTGSYLCATSGSREHSCWIHRRHGQRSNVQKRLRRGWSHGGHAGICCLLLDEAHLLANTWKRPKEMSLCPSAQRQATKQLF